MTKIKTNTTTPKPKTARLPTAKAEDTAQKAILTWARWQHYGDGKIADYLHHSPNGGKRHVIEAKKFKHMGAQAGFPDLFLFVPKGGYHGLFIELKRPKSANHAKGVLTVHQKVMLERLNVQGYKVVVCYGANAAIDEIKEYLGLKQD